MTEIDKTSTINEAKKSLPSQQGLYAKIASYSNEIIGTLYQLLQSRNENIRLGAAKVLINKILPDLKVMELTGKDGKPFELIINAVGGFIPANVGTVPAPAGSPLQGQPPVQGNLLAQTGKKDNNSNNGAGQASVS